MDISDNKKVEGEGSCKVETSPPEKVLACGIQLRASARVSKKLKLDQEQALAASPDKKCEGGSGGGGGGDEKTVAEEKPTEDRPKRVLWTADEKNAFFEALNEHGKNFEAIEKFMSVRLGRRRSEGLPIKSREQARHFYYRALQRLSRFVHFPTSVKKMTQELYTLINFGELRKKIGPVNDKTSHKLNELIYSGKTQVRVKGKTYRIRTPVCRALRRLNNLGDDCEEVRLPARVEVLLSPRSNRDALHAKISGHNPLARAVLSLDTNFSSLISFLSSRWLPSPEEGEELWVGPRRDAVIQQVQFKVGQTVQSGSVSLLAHEKRLGGDTAQIQLLIQQFCKCPKSNRAVRREKENASANEDIVNTEFIDPITREKPSLGRGTCPAHEKEEKIDKDTDGGKEEFVARAREGWNQETSSGTKIGQLYLMVGSKGVIELEYWWTSKVDCRTQLTTVLQRLVSLAKLFNSKPKLECGCGHKCKAVSKSTVSVGGASSEVGPHHHRGTKSGGKTGGGGAQGGSGAGASGGGGSAPPPPLSKKSTLALNKKPTLVALDMATPLGNTQQQVPLVSVATLDEATGGGGTSPACLATLSCSLLSAAAPGGGGLATPLAASPSPLSTASATPSPSGSSFKHPLLPAPLSSSARQTSLETLKQLQSVRPRYCNRRGRYKSRSVVVHRMLPLLPISALPSNSASRPPGGPVIKVALQTLASLAPPLSLQGEVVKSGAVGGAETDAASLGGSSREPSLTQQQQTLSPAALTTSLTDRLHEDISDTFQQKTENDLVVDSPATNSFKGILGGTADGSELTDTPPSSPSRILKEGEGQWLSSEVTDFSLSSFLGHLESPLKPSSTNSCEDIQISSDVDAHFQSLMMESSLDYTAKFADLAEKIVQGAGPSNA